MKSILHVTSRYVCRHINIAFAMHTTLCLEKKSHHIYEENYTQSTSHQNSHSTLTSLQSTVFMMNTLQRLFSFFLEIVIFIGKIDKSK